MRSVSLLFFVCASAWAQFGGEPDAAQPGGDAQQRQAIEAVKARLQSDPEMAAKVARRIAMSSFGPRITQAPDDQTQLAQIQNWMKSDPEEAALMAIGLTADDASGTHDFEKSAARTDQGAHFEFNPESKKGLFGRLKKSNITSKLLRKDDNADMAAEEQKEVLATMFQGQGAQSDKIITQQLEGSKMGSGRGTVGAGANYFNRLSAGNLHGYSPQLQALQSALNRRRVPGAPALIETGQLDYATLSYPAYGMKYDIGNLEQRLRLETNFFLAKALGRERDYTKDQLLDPALEAKLKAEAQAKHVQVPARFSQRLAALERAAAAVKEFDSSALPARDPMRISRALLMTLGSKQKEASRWITAASLLEELERLDQQEHFLSAELLNAIARAPVDESTRASYKRRGEDYQKKLKTIKANDQAAVDTLQSDQWEAKVESIELSLDDNAALRKDLFRNIQDYINTPYRLVSLYSPKPRWRELADNMVKVYLPSLAYSKRLLAVDRERALLKDVFSKIAAGDLNAAHAILASYEPGRKQ